MNVAQNNPYVGPRTFLKEESHLFFAREREASDLIALVASEQLVLFYAQSGAGKSSLINTRLIPYLESKEYEVLPVGRVSGDPLAGQNPDNVFIYNLLRSLVQQEINLDELGGLSLTGFLSRLNSNDQGFFYDDSPLPEIPEDAGYIPLRRALIIDQFEELFSTHPEAWGKREDFFSQLAQAMQDDTFLWVVLVMREEYIAALDPYAHLLPGGLRVRYYMQRLGREAALTAIRSPVQELRPFAEGAAEKLVDDLCTIKVQQPAGTLDTQPGQFAEPVQLQVVCYRLWENLSPEGTHITEHDLQEIGDVDQTLARYYEERVKAVAAAKNVSERLIREWFEKKLITTGGIRSLVPQGPTNKSGGLDDHVIQALQSDLVRAERRGGVTWYELTHDRLVEPILRNNRTWFDKNLSPLQRQAALWKDQGQKESWLLSGRALAEVEHWAKEHQPELTPTEQEFLQASRALFVRERRSRRRTRLITFLAIAAVVMAILAYQASMDARRQARLAFARQLAAQSDTLLAEYPIRSILLAIEANSIVEPGEPNPASAEEALRAALSESHGLPLPGHEKQVNTMAFSSDGRWLASGSDDNTVRLWDMSVPNSPANARILRGHAERVNTLAFSPNGNWLATGSQDDTVLLWDLTAADLSINPKTLPGNQSDVNILTFSPNGHWLASGTQDDIVLLWDLNAPDPAQNPRRLAGQGGWIRTLAFSPDSQWLATGGAGSHVSVQLWDLRGTEPATSPMELPGHSQVILSMAFSPDGRWLATGSQDNTARLWDLRAFNPAENHRILPGHSDWVNALAFSSDGHWLATGSGDRTAQLWDITDPSKNSTVLAGHTYPIKTLAFSPDGHWLATGSEDRTVRLWDMQSPAPVVNPKILGGHDAPVNALVFTREGHWLATGDGNGNVRLWEQVNRDPALNPQVMNAHEDGINTLAFSHNGRWLATGSDDGTLQLWNWDPGAAIPVVESGRLRRHTAWIQIVAFSLDDHWLASAGGDKSAWLWDLKSADPAASPIELRGHNDWIKTLVFSPDGRWLATGSADRTIRLWDLHMANPADNVRLLSGHQREIQALAFSPDGRWLATGSADNTARLWDLNSAGPIPSFRELTDHHGDVSAIVISPDGRWLVTGSDDHRALLWELSAEGVSGKPKVLKGHDGQVDTLAFSPDSHWLATGSWAGKVRLWNLWDLDPTAVPKTLAGHANSRITAIAFSPDNRWLASSSDGQTVRLWDLNSPNPAVNSVALYGHSNSVTALAFSPDGRWLATGSDDKTLRLWLVPLENLKSLACPITGRNLTLLEWEQYFSEANYRKICEQWPEGP